MVDPEAYIKSLSENQLRQIVLIPLLRSLGLRDVIEYHGGSPEKGKDLIGHYQGPLGDRHYVGVVAKSCDIHGAVSKRGSAMEVLMQAEQALNEPYTDIYDLDAVRINECWIFTSGEIKNTAVESIRGKLAKTNLDKVVRFVDRHRLLQLIALNIPTFWYHERIALQFLHEMKAPLAAILSNVNFLRRRWSDLSAEKRDLKFADIEAETRSAVHQLEFFAMMLQPDQPISVRALKLGDVLSEAVCGLDPEMRDRVQLRTDSMMVRSLQGDRSRLRHAIRCIIDNAIQYSRDNVEIQCAAEPSDNDLVIRVSDMGIGIAAGEEGHIFEPGYRAEAAIKMRPTGMGMGLSSARKIVRQHGGEVVLVHRTHPTEFHVRLPMEPK